VAVTCARRPSLAYESLEVRERLGYCKASLRRAQVRAEQRDRHVVGAALFAGQRRLGLLEPETVVLDQLSRAARRVVDRLPVARIDDAGRELDCALERCEVVAERIGTAVRIEADRGRDLVEQVVPADQDGVAEKAEMSVGVARQLDDVPACKLASFVEQLWIDRVANERRKRVTPRDEIRRHRLRHAVTDEPRGHAFRPVLGSPHSLALRVVEASLVHRSPGRRGGRSGTADVIRMEVRDRDPLDLDCVPGRVSQAEARIEEGPVDEVAVDVLRPGGQRQRQPLDTTFDRYERLFYHEDVRVEYREEPCKSALNPVKGMGFRWSLNPYMGCVHRCTFCYVRHFEKRSDRPSDDRYGTSIRVKTNVAEVLRRELARSSWQHETVAIGAATDPYQPAEGKYRLTRACLEVLRDASNPFSLITRGPMIVRDLDVLTEAAERADVSVTFSVPTLDDEVWKKTEPSTAHPRQRLKAVETLVDAGVDARVGMAPILPGISDRPEQLREVVRAAREAGATGIWANLLFLRPGTREHFLAHLAEDWPEQLPLYESLYADRAYLGGDVQKPVRSEVSALARDYGIKDRRKVRLAPPPEPEQLSLAV
jgi:DNA repair photolyase